MYRTSNLSPSSSSNNMITTKSTTMNKSNDQSPDDENWKLLKFLCDRIEENKKKEDKLKQEIKVIPHSPKPIPITTNILAPRKKKNKTFIRNNNNNNHFKTKSQALYSEAFKDKNIESINIESIDIESTEIHHFPVFSRSALPIDSRIRIKEKEEEEEEEEEEEKKGENKENPLSDPVSSLVSLVRRVTNI